MKSFMFGIASLKVERRTGKMAKVSEFVFDDNSRRLSLSYLALPLSEFE